MEEEWRAATQSLKRRGVVILYSPLAASTVVNLLFRQLDNFHLLRVISCYRAPDEVTIIVTKACANKHEEQQIGIHFNSRKKINNQSSEFVVHGLKRVNFLLVGFGGIIFFGVIFGEGPFCGGFGMGMLLW